MIRLSTLTTASEEFLDWWAKNINESPYFGSSHTMDFVHLKYDGDDIKLIVRLFKAFCRNVYPEFLPDDSHTPVMEYLASIVAKKADRQGLVFRGNIGSGKTTLMLVWTDFEKKCIARQKNTDGYRTTEPTATLLTPAKLVSDFMKDGFPVLEVPAKSPILLFDDLQELNVNYYGMPVNLAEQIITARYDRFKTALNLRLYATTNLTSSQLTKAIGQRAVSRLLEMSEWNEGLLTGDDRRKNENRLQIWPDFTPKKNYSTI